MVGDYTSADLLPDKIIAISRESEGGYDHLSIPISFKIEINDVSRSEVGGNVPIGKLSNDCVVAVNNLQDMIKDKQIVMIVKYHAYTVLGLTSSLSDRGLSIDETHFNRIVLQVKHRLLNLDDQ